MCPHTSAAPQPPPTGLRIAARRVTQQVRGAGRVLHEVSLDLAPGSLTAIAGSSGAGKTVLLTTLAGLNAPSRGTVLHDGSPPGAPGREFGFVPQEDVLHLELPLRNTLGYAAGLRMPPGTSADETDTAVRRVLASLGLSHRADTRVRDLSGGERKRAGIAAEMQGVPYLMCVLKLYRRGPW